MFATRKLTLLAMLTALAAAGRIYANVLFPFLPNLQPMTSVIIICSLLLGPAAGAIIAVLSTLLSNMILGMGLWTLWQMLAWGLIGLLFGSIGKLWRNPHLLVMTAASVLTGYMYGLLISLPNLFIMEHFLAYYVAGLSFDTMHAIGNGIFFIILYPVLSRLFDKWIPDNRKKTTSS
ncbi:energy-coupling factor transport system substrate-specific component [Terribacillus aidingensis]|uniref:Energy-coupling factor transport system substrate-specific component n=1 Tax=Terribacillus aidingensis TaxID=586416 RepID=A0A285NLR8_9BACI|nr:ECF transporter S component [Terribacillus aidingensis]SNZ10419.1 energy-coupling factor transport system substrate-specific component [Terribacillus aidingensis]